MIKEKILVVEDDEDILELLEYNLKKEGYETIGVTSGEQAVQEVRNNVPDLIILDLTMPEMDGFTVVEKLKNNEKTRPIPIIIVSAKELTSKERQFLTGQVEVLLQKGLFSETELLEDVSQALHQIHQQQEVTL